MCPLTSLFTQTQFRKLTKSDWNHPSAKINWDHLLVNFWQKNMKTSPIWNPGTKNHGEPKVKSSNLRSKPLSLARSCLPFSQKKDWIMLRDQSIYVLNILAIWNKPPQKNHLFVAEWPILHPTFCVFCFDHSALQVTESMSISKDSSCSDFVTTVAPAQVNCDFLRSFLQFRKTLPVTCGAKQDSKRLH